MCAAAAPPASAGAPRKAGKTGPKKPPPAQAPPNGKAVPKKPTAPRAPLPKKPSAPRGATGKAAAPKKPPAPRAKPSVDAKAAALKKASAPRAPPLANGKGPPPVRLAELGADVLDHAKATLEMIPAPAAAHSPPSANGVSNRGGGGGLGNALFSLAMQQL